MISDFSCTFNCYTSVGIHTSWPANELAYIINNANISCIVTNMENSQKFLEISESCPSLRYLIIIRNTHIASSKTVQVYNFSEIEEKSLEISTHSGINIDTPITTVVNDNLALDNTNDLFSLIYSSGMKFHNSFL